MNRRELVEKQFPELQGTGYQLTSPPDPHYNCIAWAIGDAGAWWWPMVSPAGTGLQGGYYWPDGLPLTLTVENFVDAYKRHGYRVCDDGALEPGFAKVAIYANAEGVPTHGARQLANGRWASKLGEEEDIEHDAAEHVEGAAYGSVAVFMRRRLVVVRPHPRVARP